MNLRERLLAGTVARCVDMPVQQATLEGSSATGVATLAQREVDSPRQLVKIDATKGATRAQQGGCFAGQKQGSEVALEVVGQVLLRIALDPSLAPDPKEAACSWQVLAGQDSLTIVSIPAMTREQVQADYPRAMDIRVAQSCGECLWKIRPGAADRGYCASPDRRGQAGPYGVAHPASYLPGNYGATCEHFEALGS